jgi:photosystem II stability/assembly factor-like uncharacterized protein
MQKNITRIAIFSMLLLLVSAGSPVVSDSPPPLNHTYLPSILSPGFVYLPMVVNLTPLDPMAFLGLQGGPMQVIAIDPHNPNVIYLGTWASGIYKSTDSGKSWAPARAGLGNQLIWSLVVDPQNSSVIYAGTHKGGLYKSIDGGSTWFLSSNGIQNSAVVYSIAINPSDSSQIFIGTRGVAGTCGGISCPPWSGIIYKSSDYGATWTPAVYNVGGPNKQFWAYSVVFDPVDSKRMMAAFDGSPGFKRSLDSGSTWINAKIPPDNPIGRSVLFNPVVTSTVTTFYAGWQAYKYDNVFRSTDGGDTWGQKTSGVAGLDVWKMAITPSSPTVLYILTNANGIYATTDQGRTWKKVSFPSNKPADLEIDPTDNNLLYAGGIDNGFYKSSDGGATWALSQEGLITTWSTALLVSPGDENHLFMSTYGQGVYQSTDRGVTWTSMSAGLGNLFIHSMVMDPAHPNLLFALTDTAGMYRYDLSMGGSWSSLSGGLPALVAGQAAPGWEILPYGPDYPFAIPEKPDSDVHPELYASQAPAAPAAKPPYLTMTFAPSDANTAYLGTNGSGVYMSSNAGSGWTPVGLNGSIVWSLAVDPADANLVYAATSKPGAVKVSTTGGGAWTDSSLPDPGLIVYSLAVSKNGSGDLYAGTTNGVYQLAGGNWTALGLPGATVTALAANPLQPDYLYAGTTNGSFFSIDAGATWRPGPAQLANLTITAIHFDPSNPNMVYYSTTADGVLRDPFN